MTQVQRQPLYPLAMSIAWEQVACWRVYMPAAEAGHAVGLVETAPAWAHIAERLAKMWLELDSAKYLREAA